MKNTISTLLLVLIASSILTGCIKKDKPVTASGSQQRIQLVYYKLFDDEDIFKPLIQEYQSKNPNVTIVYRKFTDPQEYENLIINELAEGEGPDIFSAPNFWVLRNAKKINPVPEVKLTIKQFEDTFVNVAKNDLLLRDSADGKQKVYGLPLSVDTLALYYNKAQFDDKLPAKGKPASTWEELKNDVFKLTKKDNSFERFEVSGIAMGRSDNILRAIDILYMLMLQYRIQFYNANISSASFAGQQSTAATGVSINPFKEALSLYTSFALPADKNYSWNLYLAESNSSLKEIETFARGKVTMIFGYSYLYDQIMAEIKDLKQKGVNTVESANVRISAAPQVIDPNTSTEKRVAYANYYAETVSRTSQYPNEAWDFIMFLASKDNLKYYNDKTHRPTSRRDMIDEQSKDPIFGVFAEQIGYAESIPIYDELRYKDIFSKAIDSVLATFSINDAAKTAENDINQMLPPGGMIPPEVKST